MSLITCTDACVYQEEGYCRLEQAASSGQMSVSAGCVHFVGKGGGTQAVSVASVPLSQKGF